MNITTIKVIFVDYSLEEIKAYVKQNLDKNIYELHIGEFAEGSVTFYAKTEEGGMIANIIQGSLEGELFTLYPALASREQDLIVLRFIKNKGDIRSSVGTRNQANKLFN